MSLSRARAAAREPRFLVLACEDAPDASVAGISSDCIVQRPSPRRTRRFPHPPLHRPRVVDGPHPLSLGDEKAKRSSRATMKPCAPLYGTKSSSCASSRSGGPLGSISAAMGPTAVGLIRECLTRLREPFWVHTVCIWRNAGAARNSGLGRTNPLTSRWGQG